MRNKASPPQRALLSLGYMILNTMSYQAGFYVPRLTSDGSTGLRLEYRHGSPYFYRHSRFTTGVALNRRIFGDELGPHGDGISIKLTHEPSSHLRLAFGLDYERRDNAVFAEIRKPNGDRDHLQSTTSFPAEHRIRSSLGGRYGFSDRISLDLGFQYEFTRHFNFAPKDNRHGFLVTSAVLFDLF